MKNFILLSLLLFVIYSCRKDENTIEGTAAPSIPVYQYPAENDTLYSVSVLFSWSPSADPQGDSVKYDLHIYLTPDLTLEAGSYLNLSMTNHRILLIPGNIYYWVVTAKDNHGNSSRGPVWKFTIYQDLSDGWYVSGPAIAGELSPEKIMKIGRNEVNQQPRESLLELYIPVQSGAGGFNIMHKTGPVIRKIGPAPDFQTVTDFQVDEPSVPFQRGGFIVTNSVFDVPADGLYHVVIDTELGKAVISPVHWGIIGAAVETGWAVSTDLAESSFNETEISWHLDNLKMNTGDFKFRYCNGWKIIIDSTINTGGGPTGVKINTNIGESVDNLIPGGANIWNSVPGMYSVDLSYSLSTGWYTLQMIKTGELPPTDWTNVVLDAVGTGIAPSPLNPTAVPDQSLWNWGNVVLPGNSGLPVRTGNIFTWTWDNLALEADQGFKVRTKNGIPPASGGFYFDAGFSSVRFPESSIYVIDLMETIGVSKSGFYKMTVTIDAGQNDIIEIIITEV